MGVSYELESVNKRLGISNAAFQEDELRPERYENKIKDFDSSQRQNESAITKSTDEVNTKGDPPPTTDADHQEWGGGLEFLMSCIATSVGLGNIWRFPFKAYENGGGAFLIPYIIVLFLVGKPFYYLEALLGQFTSKPCVKSWKMAPAMKGLGYGQVLAAFCVVSYYCSLMALTVYYFVVSLQSQLPWSYCRSEWGNNCFDANSNLSLIGNGTVKSAAELYFRKLVVKEADSIDDGIGLPSWQLTLCLAFSWLCIFGIMCRGVKSSGKAAYFLALFPYVVMIILLGRAASLDGALVGVKFFITPQWDALLSAKVWYAAITQCFFSLSVCFGPIITYSSHNNFEHRVDRDVMIVTTIDTFTSVMAGCTIFSILGNLAHEMGTTDVSKVVQGGTGLAFVSYPDALARFTFAPQFFSVLFFFMMFVLGTGSAIALFAGACAVMNKHFPQLPQWKAALYMSIFGFFVGLVYVTPGGLWFTDLVDEYGGTFVAIIVGVLEVITIFWIYGLRNFLNDMEFMLGIRPGLYWRLCWFLITPLLMIIVLVYTFVTYEPTKYAGKKYYPTYAYAIGWILFIIGVGQILVWMVHEFMKNRCSSFTEMIKLSFKPSEMWGPRNRKKHEEWKALKSEKEANSERSLHSLFFR